MAKKNTGTKSVSQIQEEIRKLHGTEAITTTLDGLEEEIGHISTGVLALDDILGGGFPYGRLVDIYGIQSGGKSGICYSFIAQAQKEGTCVFFDLENSYDPVMARKSGVDTDTLLLLKIEAAEDVFTRIEEFALSGEVSAIVVDSFAGLVPRAELMGEIGDSHVGLIGRLASQALRILTKKMMTADSKTIVVFVNQLRANIGAYGNAPSKIATGGEAVKFYATTRISVTRTGTVTQGTTAIGHTVKVKTDKNKIAPPLQTAEFDIIYAHGINNEGYLLDKAVDAGLVKKAGAWYTDLTTGESLGNGKPAASAKLKEEPELFERILRDVRATES